MPSTDNHTFCPHCEPDLLGRPGHTPVICARHEAELDARRKANERKSPAQASAASPGGLRSAKTAPAILAGLAARAWADAGNAGACPPQSVPSVRDLARLEDRPTLRESCYAAKLRIFEVLEPRARPGEPVGAGYLAVPLDWLVEYGGELPWVDPSKSKITPQLRALESALTKRAANPAGLVKIIHAAWSRAIEREASLPHPLAMIVEAWQNPPVDVDPQRRKDKRILPVITPTWQQERESGRMVLFAGLTDGRTVPPSLPLFPEVRERASVPILDLVDAAGVPIRSRGRGAALPQRFAIRSLVALRPQDRQHKSARLAMTLRDMRDGLYPNGWNRGRHWPQLRAALMEAGKYGILLPGARAGSHVTWFPWAVRQLPSEDSPSLDDVVVIDLALPEGSATGPLIHLPTLDQLGVESSPRYRAYIAALTVAWEPGVTRVPLADSDQWAWSGDIEAYPILTQEDRRRLAFGMTDRGNRNKAAIDAAFEDLPGVVVLDRQAVDRKTGAIGWRVVPEAAAEAIRKRSRRKD